MWIEGVLIWIEWSEYFNTRRSICDNISNNGTLKFYERRNNETV